MRIAIRKYFDRYLGICTTGAGRRFVGRGASRLAAIQQTSVSRLAARSSYTMPFLPSWVSRTVGGRGLGALWECSHSDFGPASTATDHLVILVTVRFRLARLGGCDRARTTSEHWWVGRRCWPAGSAAPASRRSPVSRSRAESRLNARRSRYRDVGDRRSRPAAIQ